MADDILINKASVIERCLQRIREEFGGDEKNLKNDFTKQDSIVLNLERACEACIDIAMHIVRIRKLGVPQESREAFDMLEKDGLIPKSLSRKLKAMVGFRNIAVHDYQGLNLDVVQSIIKKDLKDLKKFAAFALKKAKN